MEETANSKLDTRNSKLDVISPESQADHAPIEGQDGCGSEEHGIGNRGQVKGYRLQGTGYRSPKSRTSNPESRSRGTGSSVPRRRYVRSRPIQNPKSKIQNRGTPNPKSRTRGNRGQGGPLALSREDILGPAREMLHELLAKAIADPKSDAYTMLEIICLNHLIESKLKTREMDVMELLQARSQGKQLTFKAAHAEAQTNKLTVETDQVRLENDVLKHNLSQIRKELRQAQTAKSEGRPFDYERTLNQISAVVGLRGPEEFRYEKQAPQADEKQAPQADEEQAPQAH